MKDCQNLNFSIESWKTVPCFSEKQIQNWFFPFQKKISQFQGDKEENCSFFIAIFFTICNLNWIDIRLDIRVLLKCECGCGRKSGKTHMCVRSACGEISQSAKCVRASQNTSHLTFWGLSGIEIKRLSMSWLRLFIVKIRWVEFSKHLHKLQNPAFIYSLVASLLENINYTQIYDS